MLTSWAPLNKVEELMKLMQKVGKLPTYIKKWQQLTAAEGKRGIKTYNIIYIDDAKIAEAIQYISKIQMLFFEVEGYSYTVEPVLSVRDGQKIMAMKL